MQGMFNRKRPDADAVRHVKRLMAATFGLSDDTMLSVAELTCHEPGCPPVETVITMRNTDGEATDWRIAKAVCEIEERDIHGLNGST